MLYRGDLQLLAGMSYYFSSDDPANTVPVYFNAGLVEKWVDEITVGWTDKKHGFRWGINANAWFNKEFGEKNRR